VSAKPPEKFGRYKVVQELGRGAMGVVYRAQDEVLQRVVALKMIALTGSDHERDTHEARFRQEARAAGGLTHPSIITIYDVGREGDVAFIAMELVEGRELRDLIREGALTPSRAAEVAIAVAEALAYAHERGIVHRDVKPGNIMVLADGRIKIMDFGIARLQEPTVKTQTGVLLGSPQYMSPEQISGQSLDGRADVFSLGVVLYEMLTGIKPFDASDLTQVLFWVVNMPAKAPSERRPGLPTVVDFILARALKKRPEEALRECERAGLGPAQRAAGAARRRGDDARREPRGVDHPGGQRRDRPERQDRAPRAGGERRAAAGAALRFDRRHRAPLGAAGRRRFHPLARGLDGAGGAAEAGQEAHGPRHGRARGRLGRRRPGRGRHRPPLGPRPTR